MAHSRTRTHKQAHTCVQCSVLCVWNNILRPMTAHHYNKWAKRMRFTLDWLSRFSMCVCLSVRNVKCVVVPFVQMLMIVMDVVVWCATRIYLYVPYAFVHVWFALRRYEYVVYLKMQMINYVFARWTVSPCINFETSWWYFSDHHYIVMMDTCFFSFKLLIHFFIFRYDEVRGYQFCEFLRFLRA